MVLRYPFKTAGLVQDTRITLAFLGINSNSRGTDGAAKKNITLKITPQNSMSPKIFLAVLTF